jgi:shikimate dehydrogenase
LKLARERGLRTADGLGMLLHQAVRGFERWFGIRPEVTPELRALVEADLGATKPAAPVAAQEKVKPQPKRARGNKDRG